MTLSRILTDNGASSAASIPFISCSVTDERKLKRLGFEPKSVCVGVIPYYSEYCDMHRTVSAYAVPRDYHLYMHELSDRIQSVFSSYYPSQRMRLCADNSPINEIDAAARAGLGVIGRHHLLITPEHSSFVFIFEVFSTLDPEKEAEDPVCCENCGKCQKACPTGMTSPDRCLSSITQKKGELTPVETALIRSCGTVWGCDICQLACPHTDDARKKGTLYTKNEWFLTDTLNCPEPVDIENRDFFVKRAYSWRGAQPILRNIDILSGGNKSK